MAKSVIILGGGVAGMSAAHELVERGFSVSVFEKQVHLPGGKARSVPIETPVTAGRKQLPGEHGFRFFPGFYRHITDTMKRIPFQHPLTKKENPNGVYDNLVECSRIMLARMGNAPIYAPGSFPKSLADIELVIHDVFHTKSGLEPGEGKVIAGKVWQLMTSCEERRQNEYEHVGWWEFTEANKYSKEYRTLFVEGITRTLVAAKAESSSTKTDGDIVMQLLFNMSNPEIRTDRILCGPTNEVWLFPWLTYLQNKGVNYAFDSEVVELAYDEEKLTGVWVAQNKKEKKLYTADYYICALPVERVAQLLKATPDIFKLDPCLHDLIKLAHNVAWMNGIQFYLKQDVSINKGHINFADSPWALTAISQLQFWKDFDIKEYGDGQTGGIISVDVSNWEKPGLIYKKGAKHCTQKQVIAEVWEQMKRSLNLNNEVVLDDDNLRFAHIDCDIIFKEDIHNHHIPSKNENYNKPTKLGKNDCDEDEEPLLVNKIDTWVLRRESYTSIPNFFLASDYVKTYTDLATMEGANEAARRAVNNIIDAAGVNKPYCEIWNLHEPSWLLYYKWLDKKRYNKGLPYKKHEPWFGTLLNKSFNLIKHN